MTIKDDRVVVSRRYESAEVVAEKHLAQRQIDKMRGMDDSPDVLYPTGYDVDAVPGSDGEDGLYRDEMGAPSMGEVDDLLTLFERRVLEGQPRTPDHPVHFSLDQMDDDYTCLFVGAEDGSGIRSPMVKSRGSSSSASVSMCSDEPLRYRTGVGDAMLRTSVAPDIKPFNAMYTIPASSAKRASDSDESPAL